MKNFLKRHDAFNKLLALLAGIVLWATVTTINNPIVTVNYTDLIVEFSSLNYIEDSYNLVLISDEFPRVDIKVKGSNDDISRLSTSNIKLSADLSGITQPGEYLIDYTVKLPFDGVVVSAKSPEKITITVDEVQSRRIAVDINVFGESASGITYNIPYVDKEITVSGPLSELVKIDSAVVNIDINGRDDDIAGDFEIVLLDEDGKTLDSSEYVMSDKYVMLEFLSYQTKTVPIKPLFEFVSGITEDDIKSYQLSQTEVTIKGRPDVISGISEITVGPIKIDSISDYSGSVVANIPKLENITYISEIESSLTVDIEFYGVETKVFNVSKFVFDDGIDDLVSVAVKSLEIRLSGSSNAISQVDVSSISIKPIFNYDNLVSGENEIKCQIIVDSDANVSVDGDYYVILEVE